VTIDELKSRVESYRDTLKGKSGVCRFSEAGPVGISLIDALVATVESQQSQIDELKQRITLGNS